MIAKRMSSVWQVAGVAVAALGCYLASQSVAAERAALAKVDRQITAAHDEIAKLNTEINTRSRAGQIERWNMEVLALKAPRPTQYVADGVQLVSLYARAGQRPALPLDPAIVASHGAVNQVAYTPAPTSAPAAPATPRPTPERVIVTERVIAPAEPLLRTAAYVRPKVNRLDGDDISIQRAAYHPRPASLLPDDIAAIAASEQTAKKGPSKKADR